MKKVVLLIGDELRLNGNFLSYIFRHCCNANLDFDEIKFANKNDKNLPIFLQNLTKKCEFITIFASSESYGIVSKILATINSDLLELKNDTLAPSMAEKVAKNSFLMQIENCYINVLKAGFDEN